jgi:uncharacterized membrane protein YkoI
MRWMLAVALMAAGDDDPAALLKKAAFPLSEAVARAAKSAQGATPVLAEIEEEDGRTVYSVEFSQGDKVLEIDLDAKTGELVKKETESEDKSAAAKACKVTLARAIESALQKMPGLAFSAGSRIEHEKPLIEVRIVSDGKVHKVEIDGESGAVIRVKARKEPEGKK